MRDHIVVLARLLSNPGQKWPSAQSARSGQVIAVAPDITRMRRLSRKERDRVVERYGQGESQVDLAEAFSVHRDTIVRCLEAVEVDRRRPGLTDAEVFQATELYGDGLSLGDVGARLGRAPSSVRASLLRVGVPLRGGMSSAKTGELATRTWVGAAVWPPRRACS